MSPKLAILDVGHGSCAVLTGTSDTVVIDAGPGGAGLLEYLRSEDIDRVSTVVISHADADHIRGLIALLGAGVPVARVRLNTDASKDTALWRDLVYELDRRQRFDGLEFDVAILEGDVVEYDEASVQIDLLAPRRRLAALGPGATDAKGRLIESNSVSAVVRVSFEGAPRVMLAADLDAIGLDHLLDDVPDQDAQSLETPILVFPHHGGAATRPPNEGTTRTFVREILDLVRPRIVLLSIGRGVHGTPRPEVIEEIRAHEPTPTIICTQLSDHCAADVPEVAPDHLLSVFSRGRKGQRCCGGTILVLLETGAIEPGVAQHAAFVDVAAPTALCRR